MSDPPRPEDRTLPDGSRVVWLPVHFNSGPLGRIELLWRPVVFPPVGRPYYNEPRLG